MTTSNKYCKNTQFSETVKWCHLVLSRFFLIARQNPDLLRFRYASRGGIFETAFLKDFLHVVNLFLARL